jgi:uridine phosphorylase
MEAAVELGSYREFVTLRGSYQSLSVTVTSHGAGASGAAVAFEGLAMAGAKTIVRLGTSGSFPQTIRSGDLLIATAAIRDDGASDQLLPPGCPAVCDMDVTRALVESASATVGVRFATGVVLTRGSFYPAAIPTPRAEWHAAHLVGGEMELAVPYVIRQLRQVRVGGIFTVYGNDDEFSDPRDYDPHREVVDEGKEKMIDVALRALGLLAASDGAAYRAEQARLLVAAAD